MITIRRFIIVDDDIFNNTLCRLAIRTSLGQVDIKAFSVPEDALHFIQNEFVQQLQHTILFLDINMPTISGWEFIKQYEQFSDKIKEHIIIYILSSSIDQRDIDKAEASKYVNGFISKPLTIDKIRSIAG